MNTKALTKKILTIINSLKKGYAGSIDADRDWGILLILAVVTLLISGVTNAIFFVRVYDGEPLSENVDANPPLRDTQEVSERLEGIETIFEIRETEKREFIDTPYLFVDPARN